MKIDDVRRLDVTSTPVCDDASSQQVDLYDGDDLCDLACLLHLGLEACMKVRAGMGRGRNEVCEGSSTCSPASCS